MCHLVSSLCEFRNSSNYGFVMQMRPNFHPEGKTFGESKVSSNSNSNSNSNSKPITQLWQKNGMCSEGTIPIRRTRTNDILRASSVQNFGKKKQKSTPQPKPAKPLPDVLTQSGHQVLPPLPCYL